MNTTWLILLVVLQTDQVLGSASDGLYIICRFCPLEFDPTAKIRALKTAGKAECKSFLESFRAALVPPGIEDASHRKSITDLMIEQYSHRDPRTTFVALKHFAESLWLENRLESFEDESAIKTLTLEDVVLIEYELEEWVLVEKYFAVIRRFPKLALQYRIWEFYVTLTAENHLDFWPRLSIFFKAASTLLHLNLYCRKNFFAYRLSRISKKGPRTKFQERVLDACSRPFDWSVLNRPLEGFIWTGNVRKDVRLLLWSAIAEIVPEYDSIEKAARATPLEIQPELKAKCLKDQFYCRAVIVNFLRTMRPTWLIDEDLEIDLALLECFGKVMSKINIPRSRALINESPAFRAFVSPSAPFESSESWSRFFFSQNEHLALIKSELELVGQFSGVFDFVARGQKFLISEFWSNHFTAENTSDIVINFAEFVDSAYWISSVRTAVESLNQDGQVIDALRRTWKRPFANRIHALLDKSYDIRKVFSDRERCAITAALRISPEAVIHVIREIFLTGLLHDYDYRPEGNMNCGLCAGKISDDLCALAPCAHVFHRECLNRLLQSDPRAICSCGKLLPSPSN